MTGRWGEFFAVMGVIVLGIAGGLAAGPSAGATWTKTLTASGTVSAGAVAVTSARTNLLATVRNQSFQTTQYVTATNTQSSTTFTGTSNVTITARPSVVSPAPALSTVMDVTIWPVATSASCTAAATPPAGSPTGVWSTGVTSAPVALTRSQVAGFCVRGFPTGAPNASSTVPQNRAAVASALATASGIQSFTPTYVATLTLGSFTATTSGNSTAIGTQYMFPVQTTSTTTYSQVRALNSTARCLSITGGLSAAVGSAVATATCQGATSSIANGYQFIRMVPIAGTTAVSLKARLNPATNGYFQATSDLTNSAVTVQNLDTANLLQQWIPQRTNGTTNPAQYQLVNASSGLCLTAPGSAGVTTLTTCGGTTSQRFTWTAVGVTFP
ncbi:hypothetical protein QL996_12610 [Planococcus sp. APC 4015]|nr:hypothetical protein [Planococcus sp. APC 4015]